MPDKIVLLDTNFLLIPGQFGVDIFSELRRACDFPFKLAVVQPVMDELNRLTEDKATSAKDRKAAHLALQLIKVKGVPVLGGYGKVFKSADKAILHLASANGKELVVATQDRELKSMLREKGVAVAVLRQNKYIIIEGV